MQKLGKRYFPQSSLGADVYLQFFTYTSSALSAKQVLIIIAICVYSRIFPINLKFLCSLCRVDLGFTSRYPLFPDKMQLQFISSACVVALTLCLFEPQTFLKQFPFFIRKSFI